MRLVRPGRTAAWTRDRIEALSTAEVRQLRDNAARLSEAEIVALCEEVLKARPRGVKAAALKAGAAKTTKRPAAA
jgi:hypothetical protein